MSPSKKSFTCIQRDKAAVCNPFSLRYSILFAAARCVVAKGVFGEPSDIRQTLGAGRDLSLRAARKQKGATQRLIGALHCRYYGGTQAVHFAAPRSSVTPMKYWSERDLLRMSEHLHNGFCVYRGRSAKSGNLPLKDVGGVGFTKHCSFNFQTFIAVIQSFSHA